MKNKVYASMDEAVVDIPDGSTVMCPGFSGVGVPRNLLAALNRQGAKGLTAISNNAGTVDELVDVGTLVEAGQVKKVVCAFTASTHPSIVTPFTRMYNEGTDRRRAGAPRDAGRAHTHCCRGDRRVLHADVGGHRVG